MLLLLFPLACSDYDLNHGTRATPARDVDSAEPTDSATDDASDSGTGDTGDTTDTDDTDSPPDHGFDPNDPGESEPYGNVVTILMTLSDDYVPAATAESIINNAVHFVSQQKTPEVLVLRDDAAGDENADDSDHIVAWINNHGWHATLLEEPGNGVSVNDLAGYDTVILSNPGRPPDDHATIDAMRAFSAQGFGIIFQGDDMTRFADDSDTMEELTRLENVDNGTSYYGFPVDNDEGIFTYAVELDAGSPIAKGIADLTFTYGNDIDTSNATNNGIDVVAWCTIKDSDLPLKPVITAYSP